IAADAAIGHPRPEADEIHIEHAPSLGDRVTDKHDLVLVPGLVLRELGPPVGVLLHESAPRGNLPRDGKHAVSRQVGIRSTERDKPGDAQDRQEAQKSFLHRWKCCCRRLDSQAGCLGQLPRRWMFPLASSLQTGLTSIVPALAIGCCAAVTYGWRDCCPAGGGTD